MINLLPWSALASIARMCSEPTKSDENAEGRDARLGRPQKAMHLCMQLADARGRASLLRLMHAEPPSA